MAVEQQRPAAAAAAEAPDRAAGGPANSSSSGTIGCGRSDAASGSISSTSAPWRRNSAGEVLLQRALLASGRARRVRHRVEADELGGQRDERLAEVRDGIDDALFPGGELHDAIP